MASLSIRDLPDDVHRRLRIRAARAGRSMEAEVRAILESATRDESEASSTGLQDWVDSLYGSKKPKSVVDEFIRERRRAAETE